MIWTNIVFLDETGAVRVGVQNDESRWRENMRVTAAAPQRSDLLKLFKSHCHEYDDENNTYGNAIKFAPRSIYL